MNIFFLDSDPKKAAQYQCDKHVVKMILESSQLLCTCHHIFNSNIPERFYKSTHINHPCSKWVRENKENYKWLSEHALFLCEEYTYRYNKIHASQDIVNWSLNNIPKITNCNSDIHPYNFGKTPNNFTLNDKYCLTKPPQCMPDEFKVENDIVQAYRNYYFFNKRLTIQCKWTKRETPEWFLNMQKEDVLLKI